MTSILITGISGFVGGHYSQHLAEKKKECTIHGVSRSKPEWAFLKDRRQVLDAVDFHQGDLLLPEKIRQILKEVSPDLILHLAAFSSVAESWRTPVTSFLNNTNAFLNVVDAARELEIGCRILSVGSSEEYGIVEKRDLPLTENHTVIPANPYAVARVSQEYLAQIYARGYGLHLCCTRSFNHIGRGQKATFVVSSIAKQFAEIAVQGKDPVITIGNGSIVRDFIDIVDVCSAYDAIFQRGVDGETYNVCTGNAHSITDMVKLFSEITRIPVGIQEQSDLMRPIDNPILIGSYRKLQEHTGWKPSIPIEESLRKIFDYWCEVLAEG